MNSLLSGDLISQLDRLIAKYLLVVVCIVVGVSAVAAIAVSISLFPGYASHELCVTEPDCFTFFGELVSPQIEIIKSGTAIASLIVLVSGAYLAIRSYLATSRVGMLGNAISHITFFERFVLSELMRRPRLVARNVDVFALYELMFSRAYINDRFAGEQFTDAVDNLFAVIADSSARYKSRRASFSFDDHRRRMMDVLSPLHIVMEPTARIDFLETEDDVVEFLVIICRVFASPSYSLVRPERAYR